MPIDFTLNDNQRRLRRQARQFAQDVLSGVPVATRDLPSPIERFVATRPFFERLVAEGFLRKCIPVSVGGDCAGLVDLAILAEEFYTVDPNVSLTMLSTMLGLAPLVVGLFFFGSVQLFFIGILGEYIGAIHTQVLKRPHVVEKERLNFKS